MESQKEKKSFRKPLLLGLSVLGVIIILSVFATVITIEQQGESGIIPVTTFKSYLRPAWGDDLLGGLVSYYKFNESTGTTAEDLYNKVDFTLSNSGLWSTGIIDSSVGNSGTTYTVTANDEPSNSSTSDDFAFSFWTNSTSFEDYKLLLLSSAGGGNPTAACGVAFSWYDTSTKVAVDFSGTRTVSAEGVYPGDNVWAHWVINHADGGVVELWKNAVNVLNTTNSGTGCGLQDHDDGIKIFTSGSGFGVPTTTKFDELAVYNVSLNGSVIASLYNSGAPEQPDESSPVGPSISYGSITDNSSSTEPKKGSFIGHQALLSTTYTPSHYVFSNNQSGSWVNTTLIAFTSTNWSNYTLGITAAKDTWVSWAFYGNDSINNNTWTGEQLYQIKNTLPIINSTPTVTPSTVAINASVLFNVTISDIDGFSDLDTVIATLIRPDDAGLVYGDFNISKVDYVKNASNPYFNESFDEGNGYVVEQAAVYEPGLLNMWYRSGNATGNFIYFTNTTDHHAWSTPTNVKGVIGEEWGEHYVISVDGVYYMFALDFDDGASNKRVYVANSTDRVNFEWACTSSAIVTPPTRPAQNMAVWHNETDDTWHMILQEGLTAPWSLYYWNSTGLCDTWESQGLLVSGGADPWVDYRNGEFILYYAYRPTSAVDANITIATGTAINSFSTQGQVLFADQAWETNCANPFVSDPEVAIIEDGNENFDHQYYLWYNGCQGVAGVAYDNLNRSFDASHFDIVSNVGVNVTLSEDNGFFTSSYSNTSVVGQYNLSSIFANDSSNGITTEFFSVLFNVTEGLTTVINSPSSGTVTVSYQNISASVTGDSSVVNVSLYVDSVLVETNTSGVKGNYTFAYNLSSGSTSLYVEAYDDLNTVSNSDNIILNYDVTSPIISLTSPSGIKNYGASGVTSEDLNWTVTGTDADSCWYEYNEVNTTVACIDNHTTFTLVSDLTSIIFYANDTVGNLNFSSASWNYSLINRGETYSSSTTETATEEYSIDITYDPASWSSISALLWYNSTSYSTSQLGGGQSTFSSSLEVPTVSGYSDNNTFFWGFTLTNTTGTFTINTSSQYQTVDAINFTICDYSEGPQLFFKTFQESNPSTALNATFKSSWNIKNANGGETVVERSYEDLTEVNSSWGFCIQPNSSNYTVSIDVEVDATGFTKTFHYIVNSNYSNVGENISLYLLNDSLSTLTELVVKDQDNQPVNDVYITIQRYDLGTDTFYNVGMAKTDTSGSDLAYLNWYDTLYKFLLVQDGTLVGTDGPIRISATPKTFNIGTSSIDLPYEKFQDISYTFFFNESTDNFVLSYVKPSGEVDDVCLQVIKRNVTNDFSVCHTCQTSNSATLYCNIASWGNGTFLGSFYATGSPRYFIDLIEHAEGGYNSILYEKIGNDNGTGIAIIAAGLVVAMFLITPAMGVIGALGGLFLVGTLGLQPISFLTYVGITIVGGAIVWSSTR